LRDFSEKVTLIGMVKSTPIGHLCQAICLGLSFVILILLPFSVKAQTAFTPTDTDVSEVAVPIPPSVRAHALGTIDSMQISDDGTVTVSGAEVVQLVGPTFFTKVYWGDAFLLITVRTDSTTQFTKAYGGPIGLSDIAEGDFISFQGTLYTGASVLDVTATSVKDWSIQTQDDQFSGTVASMGSLTNPSASGFTLNLKRPILTTVSGSADGQSGQSQELVSQIFVSCGTSTNITRGSLTQLPTNSIQAGNTITLATGIFNHSTNTLAAASVQIYQDMSLFIPHNFVGTLKTISGSGSLPAQMTLAIPTGTASTSPTANYTINIPVNIPILNAKRNNISIGRFLTGDTVRVYGAIEEGNHSVIDAQVIRDLNI
jgi:hypothetical protein